MFGATALLLIQSQLPLVCKGDASGPLRRKVTTVTIVASISIFVSVML